MIIFLFFFLALNFPWVAHQGIAQTPNLSPGLNFTQQGKISYQQGRFAESIEFWEKAVTAFDTENDPLNQAMAFSNLSLTYQKLGKLESANTAIQKSLELLATQPNSQQQLRVLAQTLDIFGQLHLTQGQSEEALQNWQEAYRYYQQLGDDFAKIQNKLNQAQAMQTLGLYQQALTTLTEVENALKLNSWDLQLRAKALRSLGNTLRLIGELDKAQEILLESWNLAKQLNVQEEMIASQLSLGDTARALGHQQINLLITSEIQKFIKSQNREEIQEYYQDAIQWYQQVADSPEARFNQIQAQLNLVSLWLDLKRWVHQQSNLYQIDAVELEAQFHQEAVKLASGLKEAIKSLPVSRETIYAKINLAQSLVCLTASPVESSQIEYFSPIMQFCTLPRTEIQDRASVEMSWREIAELLATTVQEAERLKDERSQAYALGYLGGIYQQTEDWKTAEKLTQKALALTRLIQAPDIAYRWQWQYARLRKAQQDEEGASSAYKATLETLQGLRKDLVSVSQDTQFNFRDSLEPFYREFVEFLLKDKQPSQEKLKLSRNIIEALQLAEIDDFFREACVNAKPEQIDAVVDSSKPTSAVLYAIILKNSLKVILKLPQSDLSPEQQSLLYHSQLISQEIVEHTLSQLQLNLIQNPDGVNKIKQLSNSVYHWLIEPFEVTLKSSSVKTLVFVLDGSLRNIPMSVLYDGQQYLLEKYAIALTPGLQLIEPKPLAQVQLKALTAGISEAIKIDERDFTKLKYVEEELKGIPPQVRRAELINEQFTQLELQAQLNSENFSVVHLATHGQFSSDPNKTYILIWKKLLRVKELETLLRTREREGSLAIELLVLSACETAMGDNRATLGLAGIAVRSGARSTLATLWQVNDESTTQLMTEFYKQLNNNPNLTKAEALQKAQLALWKNQQIEWFLPHYWGAYVLVGNWL